MKKKIQGVGKRKHSSEKSERKKYKTKKHK